MRRLTPLILFLVPVLALTAAPVLADREDHDRARKALERGEILPLSRILDIARADSDGRVIEVDLDRDDGRWVYELDLLTRDGRLLELEIVAASGRIIERDFDDEDD